MRELLFILNLNFFLILIYFKICLNFYRMFVILYITVFFKDSQKIYFLKAYELQCLFIQIV